MTSQPAGDSLQVVTIDLQGMYFALETRYVREILDICPTTEVPRAKPFVNRLLNVRGKIVPLADLRLKLGLEQRPATIDSRIIVLEVDIADEPIIVAVIADKVHEVIDLATTTLTQAPRLGLRCRPEHVRCIGQRGDDFLVVLDPVRIFSGLDARRPDGAASSSPDLAA